MKLENNIKSSDNIMELYRERIDENLINQDFTITDKKVINYKIIPQFLKSFFVYGIYMNYLVLDFLLLMMVIFDLLHN